MKEKCHSFCTEITAAVATTICCVYLRIGVDIADTLNIDNNHLVTAAFECEMAKCLQNTKYTDINTIGYLWCFAINIGDKTRIAIVLDVVAFDEMLQMIQRFVG